MQTLELIDRLCQLEARLDDALEFALVLKTKGYRASTATGKELLAVVSRHQHPSAVPVDYAGLRSDQSTHRVTVYQKPTGAAQGENIEALSHAYVQKPSDVGKILKRTRSLFSKQGISKWRKREPSEQFSERLRAVLELSR